MPSRVLSNSASWPPPEWPGEVGEDAGAMGRRKEEELRAKLRSDDIDREIKTEREERRRTRPNARVLLLGALQRWLICFEQQMNDVPLSRSSGVW
jgi:hypothetical protein